MNSFKLSLALLLFASTAISSCDEGHPCKRGDGGIITKTLPISSFSGIDFQEAGEIIISQGATQEVVAVGHANVVENIEGNVHNGDWEIDLEHGCYDHYDLTIYITIPELDAITLSGAGHITVNDFNNQGEDLEIILSGSGSISMHNFTGPENLWISIGGSGTITSYGAISTLQAQQIKIGGSGNYLGFNNPSDNCSIDISGSGKCEVVANQTLDVNISGSGNVYYKGHPTVTSDISGSGAVIDAN